MAYENINLWFARNVNHEIITVDKINNDNKHEEYVCPICGSKVIARTGKVITRHFAHIDKSKCDSETQVHFWIKNELIKQGDKFKIRLYKDTVKEFVCKEVLIEQQYKTKFGIYKPDITIITEADEVIYFEVANTNKKKLEEYIGIWLELGNIVVEVETKDLINGNEAKEFKAKSYKDNFDKNINVKRVNNIKNKLNKSIDEFNSNYFYKIIWLFNDFENKDLNVIEDKMYIFDILNLSIEEDLLNKRTLNSILNSKCIDIKDEFIEFRLSYIKNSFSDKINDINKIVKSYFGCFEYILKDCVYYKNNVINVERYQSSFYNQTKDILNRIYVYNSNKDIVDMLDSLKEQEENKLKAFIEKRERDKESKFVKENVSLKVCEYLKTINSNYSNFVNYNIDDEHNFIDIDINDNNVMQIKIPQDLKNVEQIYVYIKNIIEDYRKDINILTNINDIEKIYSYINNNLSKVSPLNYIYYTRMSSWHPRKHKAVHKYKVYGELISEEEYVIEIDMLSTSNLTISFTNNKIQFSTNEFIYVPDMLNIYSHVNEIMDIISRKIRENRYKISNK